MESCIVVLAADHEEGSELCDMLKQWQLLATPVKALSNLEEYIQEKECQLALIDLDTLSLDTTVFRKLKRLKPALNIIGFSSRSFHPELKEAMSHHIYACLNKPIDEDELAFCVKSVL